MRIDGAMETEASKISEKFNLYFQSVFKSEPEGPLPDWNVLKKLENFDPISDEELNFEVSNLVPGKAPGPDGITPQFLTFGVEDTV